MASVTSGRRRIGFGLAAAAALAALIGTSALAFTSCAHEQTKNGQAFAQGKGGPGGQPPDGENGGPGGPPPDGENGNPPGPPPDGKGGQGGPGGPGKTGGQEAKEPTRIAATLSVIGTSETKSGIDYSATAADSSVIYVGKSGSLQLSASAITKSGKATNNDQSSFYGVDAAILAAEGGQLRLSDAKLSTDGDGANALVATGEGTKSSPRASRSARRRTARADCTRR